MVVNKDVRILILVSTSIQIPVVLNDIGISKNLKQLLYNAILLRWKSFAD